MDLIRTGLGITRTIKNMSRFKEIITVFAKNGFYEVIAKSGLLKMVPDFVLPSSREKILKELEELDSKEISAVVGHRLRKCFEELGPSFIKLGQLLSAREDIFPKSFIVQMRILQDKVRGVPFEQVEKSLEASFGRPIDEIFESIEPIAVGTASIGVVHKAVLKSGETVVIKVRRPNISQIIETDFDIMMILAESLERMSEDVKYLGISKLIEDFHKSLGLELDFNIEALNAEKIKSNLDLHDKTGIFYLPKIYKELVTSDVLVMEYLDGVAFSDIEGIQPHLKALTPKLTKGIALFTKAIIEDGFFHADLHGGNFFYLKEKKKIGIIDFGLVGSMSRKAREHFVAIIYFLINKNYENLVYEFLEVAEYEQVPDVDSLIRDVKDNISPYVGLSVQSMDFPRLTRTIIRTMTEHRIYLPRDWYIVFRALLTMDGVGKSLGIDFDILEIVEDDIIELMGSFTSKDALLEEGVWVSRDFLSALRTMPRHLKWFLKDFSKKNYTFEVTTKGYEKQLNRLGSSIIFLGYCLLASMLAMGGVHLVGDSGVSSFDSIPRLSLIFWSLAIFLFIRGIILVRK